MIATQAIIVLTTFFRLTSPSVEESKPRRHDKDKRRTDHNKSSVSCVP